MNAPWIPVTPFSGLALLLLLGANAVLVASELALIRLRFSHLNPHLLDRLRERPGFGVVIGQADLFVKVMRLGIALCLVGYAVLLVPWLAHWMGATEAGTSAGSAVLAWAAAFLLAVAVHHVLGELVPRALGLEYPLGALSVGRWLVRPLALGMGPFLRPLERVARILLRVLRVNPDARLGTVDLEGELELLGENAAPVTEVTRNILRNALSLRDLVVSDILLPRHQVQYFDLNDPVEVNLDLARKTGHTRFPLCEGDLDRCIGLIHIKDIFRAAGDWRRLDLRRLRRAVVRVGSEEPLEVALEQLLRSKTHMGLVVDEFGGTQGVFTLEGILEELVGDIHDEFDTEEVRIRLTAPGEYEVSGLTPLHELEEELGITLENPDVSTISGLITSELGRIPEKGESLSLAGMTIKVCEVDEKRVILVSISLPPIPFAE